MEGRWLRSAVWATGMLVAVVACGPGDGSAEAPAGADPVAAVDLASATAATAASATAATAESTTSAVAASATAAPDCGPRDGPAFEDPDWPLGGDAEAAFMPVIASSLISVGPSRFLYNVLDEGYRQLAAPDVTSHVDFYALERDAETPVASVEASYLSAGLGRGLYRATVEFDCVGEWGAEVSATLADGSIGRERLRFQVHPSSSTPAIGTPAPRSESLTATTLQEVRRISSDPNPYPAAYTQTVAEAVTSGRPSIIFFATPAFCQTGYCGPTIELVKSVAREYEGRVTLVNVEPYELHETVDGLRPALDADGHLQPVAAALDYGIPVEPYLFLVDAHGDVFAKFEGIVGGDELRAAIEDALAENTQPASACSPDAARDSGGC
jgi:hypothetical protein